MLVGLWFPIPVATMSPCGGTCTFRGRRALIVFLEDGLAALVLGAWYECFLALIGGSDMCIVEWVECDTPKCMGGGVLEEWNGREG